MFHVLIEFHVFLFTEWLTGVRDFFDPGNPEVPVIPSAMAPADEVPVKRVKNQSDGFDFPFAVFLFLIQVFKFYD